MASKKPFVPKFVAESNADKFVYTVVYEFKDDTMKERQATCKLFIKEEYARRFCDFVNLGKHDTKTFKYCNATLTKERIENWDFCV